MIDCALRLRELEPYDPKYLPAQIYLNANENPHGLPEAISEQVSAGLKDLSLHRYPDPLAFDLRQIIAATYGISPDSVLAGNGGDELLFDICLAYGGQDRQLLDFPPTFSVYSYDALLTLTKVLSIRRDLTIDAKNCRISCSVNQQSLLQAAKDDTNSIIMLASPNNPTGECLSLEFIDQVLSCTNAIVVLDQAYIEFADPGFDALPLLEKHRNLAILRTFSKAFALAGLRVGYLLADPELISQLKKVRQPYSLNSLSAYAATVALRNAEKFEPQIADMIAQREYLACGLRDLAIPVADSQANFVLLHIRDAHQIWLKLYEDHRILVRDLSHIPGLEDCLRVSVGTGPEISVFLDALATLL
jgi:histidinol-phosphate aminotransferase